MAEVLHLATMRAKARSLFLFVFVIVAACSTTPNRAEFDNGKKKSGTDDTSTGPQFDESDGGKGCAGLECAIADCGSGDTTISGTVFAPDGKLPLYNALVYVPNAKLDELPKGVTCDQCGGVASGSPITNALSAPDGSFQLKRVPAGKNVPLVIQMGKWRREVKIPVVNACEDNALPPTFTRLPKNRTEGNMPTIALTTGGCDNLGCMLPKVGIDPSEIGVPGDGDEKAVHVYLGSSGQGPAGSGNATNLWSNIDTMKKYDMLILSCECNEALANKGKAANAAMTEYLNAGGRIFTTDFMYTWYRDTTDAALKSALSITGGAPGRSSPVALNTSFPKGQALADYLKHVFPKSVPVQSAKVPFDSVYGNIASLDPSKSQSWAAENVTLETKFPRIFTVNAPAGVAAEKQCGKGVHIDAHVNSIDKVNSAYPLSCSSPLNEGEATLAFFFFDLASCIQDDSKPPITPPTN